MKTVPETQEAHTLQAPHPRGKKLEIRCSAQGDTILEDTSYDQSFLNVTPFFHLLGPKRAEGYLK